MSRVDHHPPAAGHRPPGPDAPILQHHFDDLEQQHESSNLGMWAFLATEVMFFGGLIAAYAIYREHEATLAAREHVQNMFYAASRHLSVTLGCLNTVVLLTSSLTMALGVRAAQLHDVRGTVRYLLATMALGTAFLGVKAVEWTTDYHEHLMPGIDFDWEKANQRHAAPAPESAAPAHQSALSRSADNPRPDAVSLDESVDLGAPAVPQGRRAEMFFVFYFFMTGLHAIHMIIGVAVVGVMAWLAERRWLSGAGATQIEMTGLYWHFVDIVWVFLYPLLYLIDVHK